MVKIVTLEGIPVEGGVLSVLFQGYFYIERFIREGERQAKTFMYGHIIALDNQMGVHPVGFRETWIRLFKNCVQKTTVHKATNYQDEKFCAKLKAVIDGAVHGV